MSRKSSTNLIESAGGARSEPGGRAQRPAGGEPLELPEAIRDRLADDVIDELLERVPGPRRRSSGRPVCSRS